MARALIVGCGCRGRELGTRLAAEGLVVRGTTRREEGMAPIEAAGFEAALADPGRPGTILDLVPDAALVVWLLGSAAGDPGDVAALNGERLEGLLARLVDTPVRGFAYEGSGTAAAAELARGRDLVAAASATWSIPAAFIERRPQGEWQRWSVDAAETVLGLLR